jgi:hypothetical protein
VYSTQTGERAVEKIYERALAKAKMYSGELEKQKSLPDRSNVLRSDKMDKVTDIRDFDGTKPTTILPPTESASNAQTGTAPAAASVTKLYSKTVGGGGSGVFFINSAVSSGSEGELISKRKATALAIALG